MNKETIEEAAKKFSQLTWEVGKYREAALKSIAFKAGANWALSQSEGKPKKKLEEITDEDSIQVCKICYPDVLYQERQIQLGKNTAMLFRTEMNEFETRINFNRCVQAYQYLESKGYYLPRYYPSPELTQKEESEQIKSYKKQISELQDKLVFERRRNNKPSVEDNRLKEAFEELLSLAYTGEGRFAAYHEEAKNNWREKAGLPPKQ